VDCSEFSQFWCVLRRLSDSYDRCVNLKERAVANGVHPHTAYRWFREGTLPVPAERVGPRTILVNIDAYASPSAAGGAGLYARVSSYDQKDDLERQVARLSEWAARAGQPVVRIESETASGANGGRPRTRPGSDPLPGPFRWRRHGPGA
jgi:putative resolvase